jgi:acid phosphatase family membrane protein YuiD
MTVGSVVTRYLGVTKHRIFYVAALIFMVVWGGLRYLPAIFGDRYISASLLSMFCAQGMKPLTVKTTDHKCVWCRALKCGGMPSSHAAVVGALATSLGLEYGWASPLFQLAAVLSGIVIYDAITLRRMVGEHSRILKELAQDRADAHFRLGEMAGHTPLEATAGLLLGIICAVLVVCV